MVFHSLLLFVLACLSINLIPGPDVIYIVSTTLRGTRINGLKAALGLGVGYGIHTFAACIGLSAILVSSSLAFSVVKWGGALYLLYLGVVSLRSMWYGQSQLIQKAPSTMPKAIFRQGVVVSVLNPKVALFFLSFLPQFIDPAWGATQVQLFELGLIFSVLATSCNMAYALLGSWVLHGAHARRYSRILDGVSGGLLVCLAGKVALSQK